MKKIFTFLLLAASGICVAEIDDSSGKVDPSAFVAPRYSPWPAMTAGVEEAIISLNGVWKFDPDPEESFFSSTHAPEGSEEIRVPGEWSMQGFTVPQDRYAGYFRSFDLPVDWKGKRVKVRFDGVYSDGIVWVNGKKAGQHQGGFTPFELDISDLVKPGKRNVMTLAVCNESHADRLASGSQYASHILGGITRKVTLFALPDVNLASLTITTELDEDYEDAVLQLTCNIANESRSGLKEASLRISLLDAKGEAVEGVDPVTSSVPGINKGETEEIRLNIPVENPAKWTSETPELYQLQIELHKDGEVLQRSIRTVGFREIEVEGNRLLVNGQPVKLRGVCRHEVHPLTGRSLSQAEWEADARLYREANVNLIRTSHYPPPEEFVQWCDRYGLWVECEAPFCWSHREGEQMDPKDEQRLIVGQNLEMVTFLKNHPSILYWSLANESIWNDSYVTAALVVKREDPGRPRTFNYFPWNKEWQHQDEHYCEIGSDHYPGSGGPEKFRDANRPINFGEYCHLNAYNRFELASDPGVRDAWGKIYMQMWDEMFQSPGVLGGSLWAAMDDEFHMPDGTVWGYGQWGPLDAWRRKKPEWYHMKKTYSPLRIAQEINSGRVVELEDGKVVLDVLNQSNHSNLKALDISWRCGSQNGKIIADVAPHAAGKLIVSPEKEFSSGSQLEIVVHDHRGLPFEVDRYQFTVGKSLQPLLKKGSDIKSPYQIVQSIHETEVSHPSGLRFVAHKRLNNVFKLFMGRDEVVAEAPRLMILPLNSGGVVQLEGTLKFETDNRLCSEWKCTDITSKLLESGNAEIVITGEYLEAAGTYVIVLAKEGRVTLSYDFTLKTDIDPRQTGVVYCLNRDYEKFSWTRQGQWSVYPGNHIGRNKGTAWPQKSLLNGEIVGSDALERSLLSTPGTPWCLEGNLPGTHDFRSTKEKVVSASFDNEKNGRSFLIHGRGKQAVRAWVDGIDHQQIRVLIADYNNSGAEHFLKGHTQSEKHPLKKGDRISGTHLLELH